MSSINTKALPKISYGLFIITSRKGGRFNGQVANTVFQVSSEPVTIGISINRNNLTNEFIKDSKLFAVSILARD
ncbi:MAG: flavin reductase family protein, partial [Heliobacteriaceae bacterium]|nr:flavin reductase family protein [Heliobacteriaceae bacterium]